MNGARSATPPRGVCGREMPLAQLARFRQAAYRLLGAAFLYPDRRRLLTLAAAARQPELCRDWLAHFPFFQAWRKFLAALKRLPEDRAERLQQDYLRLFSMGRDEPPCLPYASLYGERDGWPGPAAAARVQQLYATCGLALSPALAGELPDHVAVELEFMSFLCGREAEQWTGGAVGYALGILEQQRPFLSDHLGRWLPRFAHRLGKAARAGFYLRLADASLAFVDHDTQLVEALTRLACAAEANRGAGVSA